MSYLFALISLILGLHFLKENLIVSLVLTLLFVIFIIYRFGLKKSALFLSLFLVGALFSNIPRTYNSPDQTYSGVVISSKQNYFLLYSHGERFYVYEKDTERELGDFLEVRGEVTTNSFTTYESQSDFNEYLSRKGVTRGINSRSIDIVFNNPIRKSYLKKSFFHNLNENAASLADALLFNTKDYGSNVVQVAEDIYLIFL